MNNKPLLLALIICASLGVLAASWVGIEAFADLADIVLPWKRAAALRTVREWGGLAPLPDSADKLDIAMAGNANTRTFTVSFKAPLKDIRRWVWRSVRLRDLKGQRIDASRIRFEVSPGEKGSAGGWVEIYEFENRVVIEMAWS